jgi:hypothetical protein
MPYDVETMENHLAVDNTMLFTMMYWCDAPTFIRYCRSDALMKANLSELRNVAGHTLLSYACGILTRHPCDTTKMICLYLLHRCPDTVNIASPSGRLPIHWLSRSGKYYEHVEVRQIVVELLRLHPDCFQADPLEYVRILMAMGGVE